MAKRQIVPLFLALAFCFALLAVVAPVSSPLAQSAASPEDFGGCPSGTVNLGCGCGMPADAGCGCTNPAPDPDCGCGGSPNACGSCFGDLSCLATPTAMPMATGTAMPTATGTAMPTATPPFGCNLNVQANVIDFEELQERDDIAQQPISSAMLSKYGAQFTSLKGGSFAVAKIALPGGPTPAFRAWHSALCSGSPHINRLCNGGNSGTRALSFATATSSTAKEFAFMLTLIEPVTAVSFDILDLDGDEIWTISANDSDGNALPAQKITSSGYGSGSRNNAATTFKVETAGKQIKSITVRGTKSYAPFGFAFDNFVTGLVACPKTAPATATALAQ